MAGTVIDVSFSVDSIDLVALKAAGVTGLIGYMAFDSQATHGKILRPQRAHDAHALGYVVAFVFEQSGMEPFGAASDTTGHAHSVEANRQGDMHGLPDDRPIYYACDADDRGQPGWQVFVAAYLDAARNAGPRPVGVYGSVRLVDYMVSHGHAAYGWQTESWSNGQVSPRACLLQHPDPQGSYDLNTVLRADWGQWPYAPTNQPTAPSEDDDMEIWQNVDSSTHGTYLVGAGKTVGLTGTQLTAYQAAYEAAYGHPKPIVHVHADLIDLVK